MARVGVLRGVLNGLLRKFESRNSDYKGYWLPGFLISVFPRWSVDLMHPVADDPGPTPDAFARRWLAREFQRRLAIQGVDPAQIASAEVFTTAMSLDGRDRGRTIYRVHLAGRVKTHHGGACAAQVTIRVGRHEQRLEQRRIPSHWGGLTLPSIPTRPDCRESIPGRLPNWLKSHEEIQQTRRALREILRQGTVRRLASGAVVEEDAALLVQCLKHPSTRVRWMAAMLLGRERVKSAAAALTDALNDPRCLVRLHAVNSLGRVGDGDQESRVYEAVADPCLHVRLRAVSAVGRLCGERCLPFLLRLIRDDSELGWQARRALDRIVSGWAAQRDLVEAILGERDRNSLDESARKYSWALDEVPPRI